MRLRSTDSSDLSLDLSASPHQLPASQASSQNIAPAAAPLSDALPTGSATSLNNQAAMQQEVITVGPFTFSKALLSEHIAARLSDDANKAARSAARQPSTRPSKVSSSKFKGVNQHARSKRWEAHIWDGRQVHVGCFDEEIQAAIAHDVVAFKFRGDKAVLNLPVHIYEEHFPILNSMSQEQLVAVLRASRRSQACVNRLKARKRPSIDLTPAFSPSPAAHPPSHTLSLPSATRTTPSPSYTPALPPSCAPPSSPPSKRQNTSAGSHHSPAPSNPSTPPKPSTPSIDSPSASQPPAHSTPTTSRHPRPPPLPTYFPTPSRPTDPALTALPSFSLHPILTSAPPSSSAPMSPLQPDSATAFDALMDLAADQLKSEPMIAPYGLDIELKPSPSVNNILSTLTTPTPPLASTPFATTQPPADAFPPSSTTFPTPSTSPLLSVSSLASRLTTAQLASPLVRTGSLPLHTTTSVDSHSSLTTPYPHPPAQSAPLNPPPRQADQEDDMDWLRPLLSSPSPLPTSHSTPHPQPHPQSHHPSHPSYTHPHPHPHPHPGIPPPHPAHGGAPLPPHHHHPQHPHDPWAAQRQRSRHRELLTLMLRNRPPSQSADPRLLHRATSYPEDPHQPPALAPSPLLPPGSSHPPPHRQVDPRLHAPLPTWPPPTAPHHQPSRLLPRSVTVPPPHPPSPPSPSTTHSKPHITYYPPGCVPDPTSHPHPHIHPHPEPHHAAPLPHHPHPHHPASNCHPHPNMPAPPSSDLLCHNPSRPQVPHPAAYPAAHPAAHTVATHPAARHPPTAHDPLSAAHHHPIPHPAYHPPAAHHHHPPHGHPHHPPATVNMAKAVLSAADTLDDAHMMFDQLGDLRRHASAPLFSRPSSWQDL